MQWTEKWLSHAMAKALLAMIRVSKQKYLILITKLLDISIPESSEKNSCTNSVTKVNVSSRSKLKLTEVGDMRPHQVKEPPHFRTIRRGH